MKFENADLKTTFELPDRPTVRQVLNYRSIVEVENREGHYYERWWTGLKSVATNWQSEHIALDADLDDTPGTREAIEVMRWSGLQCWTHMTGLSDVQKNS